MSILGEIKRRKVFQVAAVYAVVAWLTIQVVGAINEPLSLPDWLDTVVIVLLLVGFPIAVILAWAFDITPQGIERDSSTRASAVSQPLRPQWPNYLTHGLVLIAVGFLLLNQYVLTVDSRREEAADSIGSQPPDGAAGGGKPVQFVVDVPPGTALAIETNYPVIDLSPDGATLVFVAEEAGTRRLYLRNFAETESRPVPGTEGAVAPFFSPDGASIAFIMGSALMRIASSGVGTPTTLRDRVIPDLMRGATWADPDSIMLASGPNSGLTEFRLPYDGEAVELTTMPSAWPDASPTGVLFVDNSSSQGQVALLLPESREPVPLVNASTSPRFSATGHVLYARSGTLYAARFDDVDTAAIGSEYMLANEVVTGTYGAAQFAVSNDGTLAYIAGPSATAEYEIVMVDRNGNTESLFDDGLEYFHPRLSEDGRSLAVMRYTGSNSDVWVLDLERGNVARWTTHSGEDFGPVWSPDGRLALASEIDEDTGELGPGMALMSGPGQRPERLIRSPDSGHFEFPMSWSPDGQSILFMRTLDSSQNDILVFDVESRVIEPFVATPFSETAGRFSPNGEWVAYVSDQTERPEVYLQRFDGSGNAIQVSTNGGTEPVWSRTGAELYYREGNKLMVVEPGDDPQSGASAPRALFEAEYEKTIFGGENANYDVSSDGRFIMIRQKNRPTLTTINVVLNWPDALGVP